MFQKCFNFFLTVSKCFKKFQNVSKCFKVLDNGISMAQSAVGTPYYLSPELCEGKPYDYKSDVWALGCVAHEMTSLKYEYKENGTKYEIKPF